MNECPLCSPIEHKTKWYYEDKDWAVLDCDTCGVPMIVYKKHGESPTVDEFDELLQYFTDWNLIGSRRIRTEQRKIKDHWHIHLI